MCSDQHIKHWTPHGFPSTSRLLLDYRVKQYTHKTHRLKMLSTDKVQKPEILSRKHNSVKKYEIAKKKNYSSVSINVCRQDFGRPSYVRSLLTPLAVPKSFTLNLFW